MSPRTYRSATAAVRALQSNRSPLLFTGDSLHLVKSLPDESIDLTVTSPPYCMGKEYDTSTSVDDFIAAHRTILPEIARVTKTGGSICWQVGYHVKDRTIYPLDYAVYSALSEIKEIRLRNRLIWTFGFGMHQRTRFSGRHETVLWFSKGDDFCFDLDAVRTPQKYPGKRRYKGSKKGEYSCNPKGKNPGDVWEIPNVKASHIEKLEHPCQFPTALAVRLIRALSSKGGIVFDPYSGTASTGVAALLEGRRFLGAEINPQYQEIARERLLETLSGKSRVRPLDRPLYAPRPNEAVSQRPPHFKNSK